MARLDDLVKQVADKELRQKLERALADLKKRQRYGLVFEEHIPETSTLLNLPVVVGATVQRRDDPDGKSLYQVKSLGDRGTAQIEPEAGGPVETTKVKDLMVVKRFGDPIFPALTPLGSVERGPKDKPYHTVINGENFHALQLLAYLYRGKIDCIYIDPPYNTGARDWKYNNCYVDNTDVWRHSKWLAFMKRRLKLAKQLLNPADSVLIVTIDEKEGLRLGLLLEQVFEGCNIQMVSTLVNPASVARAGSFGRCDEYIFFVMMGAAAPQRVRLSREWVSARGRTHTGNVRWDLLRRSGPNAARRDRPGLFYPIYIDPTGPRIAEVGEPLPLNLKRAPKKPGLVTLLPIRKDRSEGNWQVQPSTLLKRIGEGRVRVSGSEKKGYTISVLKNGEYAKIKAGEYKVTGNRPDGSVIVADSETDDVLAVPSTQWRISSHDATQYGSRLLADLIPGRTFPFPKSLYAVEDTIRFFVQDKPNAVILDFFGGSGTTAHAVFRLNHEDDGQRRSITVTNNEVSAEEAESLREKGLRPGDRKWEALGIFEHITLPRIKAAITGTTPEGTALAGNYKFRDEFPMADGFQENVEFLRIDYLDPDEVDLGAQFGAILPSLWLSAGAKGTRKGVTEDVPFAIPKDSTYAILFEEKGFRKLRQEVQQRPDLTHVWIVTDSEDAFAEMRSSLPSHLVVSMLYRDYLRNFRVNTRHTV